MNTGTDYLDMNADIKYYDISNFNKNTNKPIKPEMNYKIPGLLKEELPNTEIIVGIFNGPTSYIPNCSNEEKIAKSKGTKKNVVKFLESSDYSLALKTKRPIYKKTNSIQVK